MQAKLRDVKIELRRRKHLPIPEQGKWLGSVVRGYLGYHGIPSEVYYYGPSHPILYGCP